MSECKAYHVIYGRQPGAAFNSGMLEIGPLRRFALDGRRSTTKMAGDGIARVAELSG